ncbi:MAG: DUF2911 domain-containing protein [Opitutaceae bacterium]|nr:DUF2911 domain-containing protein [Opitutaceae bacterium]
MIPNRSLVSLLLASLLLPASALLAQAAPVKFPDASPKGKVTQRVGITDIEIEYSRPGVKGRTIFGGLEAWDKVWRTGANQATKVTFSTSVKFGGQDVAAGTYSLHTIPSQTEWTVILNSDSGQWGSYSYDQAKDVARVKVAPVKLADLVETLTIDVNDIRDESATLNIAWEKTRVSVKIEIPLVATLVPQIEALMASGEEKKPYFQAAMFYFTHNVDLKKALAWMDEGLKAQPDAFYMVYRKGLILEKMGDKAGALAAAKQSLQMLDKAPPSLKDEYTRLNEALIARVK